MNSPPAFRFTTRDGLIWIAAAGFGFGIVRAIWYGYKALETAAFGESGLPAGHLFIVVHSGISAVVLCFTIAHLVCWMIADPRPLSSKLAAPGFAAAFATAISVAVTIVIVTPRWITIVVRHRNTWEWKYFTAIDLANFADPNRKAIAILSVFAFQYIQHRFRPEPTWRDRIGRALALYWILAPIIYLNITTFCFV